MKKSITTFLLVIMVLCVTVVCSAQDNLTWDYSSGVLTIKGSGPMMDYSADGVSAPESPWSEYSSQITKVVIQSGVTTIGNDAFFGMSRLTDIQIPNTVVKIGNSAFEMAGLIELNLPNNLKTIGNDAFATCSKLKSVVLPARLQSMGEEAFVECTNLEKVIISNGIKTIGMAAFAYCPIVELSFPESITEIGAYAFYGCTDLESIKFYGSMPGFGEGAFCGVSVDAYYPKKDCTWNAASIAAIDETLNWLPGNHTTREVHIEVKLDAKSATCTESGFTQGSECEICNKILKKQTEISKKGHSFGAWKVAEAATVLKTGIKKRTCSVCKKTESASIAKLTATIKQNVKTLKLKRKQSVSLNNQITGLAKGDYIVSWSSDRTDLARVANGKVTAGKKNGTVHITVKTKAGAKAVFVVTIQTTTVKTTSLKVNKSNLSLSVKEKFQIKVSRLPITAGDKIKYSSSNKKVASVTANGLITAKKKGKATITVKSGSKKIKIRVVVKA